MVIVMKPGVSQEKIQALVHQLERDHGVTASITNGIGCSILGLVGDTAHIDMDKLSWNDDVERVMRVQEPYKKANRKFHPEDTVVDVSGVPIGGGDKFTVIAGPCSVESEEQITGVAQDVKGAGAALLRGGAFTDNICQNGLFNRTFDIYKMIKSFITLGVLGSFPTWKHDCKLGGDAD